MKILLLTLNFSCDYSVPALQSGALDYLLKESIEEELVAAIHTVMPGTYNFGAGVTNPLEFSGQQVGSVDIRNFQRGDWPVPKFQSPIPIIAKLGQSVA